MRVNLLLSLLILPMFAGCTDDSDRDRYTYDGYADDYVSADMRLAVADGYYADQCEAHLGRADGCFVMHFNIWNHSPHAFKVSAEKILVDDKPVNVGYWEFTADDEMEPQNRPAGKLPGNSIVEVAAFVLYDFRNSKPHDIVFTGVYTYGKHPIWKGPDVHEEIRLSAVHLCEYEWDLRTECEGKPY